MTTHTMDHSAFLARIDMFLAGGLTDELDAFVAHRNTCASCAAALAEAQAADEQLRALFDSARPGADFEDRLVAKLRYVDHQPDRRRMIHPAVRRVAVGVAAAILVVAIGYESDKYMNSARPSQAEEASVAQSSPTSQPVIALNWSYDGGVSNGRGEGFNERPRDLTRRDLSSARALAENLGDQIQHGGAQTPAVSSRLDVLRDEPQSQAEGLSSKAGNEITLTKRYSAPAGGDQAWAAAGGRAIRPTLGGVPSSGTQGRASLGMSVAPDEKDSLALPTDLKAKTGGGGSGGGGSGGAVAGFGIVPGLSTAGPGGGAGGAVNGPVLHDSYEFKANADGGKGDAKKEVSLYVVDGTISAGATAAPAPAKPGAAQLALPRVEYFRVATDGERFGRGGQSWDKTAGSPRLYDDAGAHFSDSLKGFKNGNLKALDDDSAKLPEAQKIDAAIVAPAELSKAGEKTVDEAPKTSANPVVLNGEVLALQQGVEPSQKTQGPENKPGEKPSTSETPPAKVVVPDEAVVRHVVADQVRKIIRNGEMAFEVDSFDTSYLTIARIVQEEGGFVSTTDSEKLANGKVKGTVIVRCPPERLETLVLKLRALGELKNSKITAQDITKQFTDLQAQLRAAKTMEERLLEIVKKGTATKDLLEAEKQLGVWREKIERLQGEINYYGDQVSLSTLTITLMERDIRRTAALEEREQVQMNVETEDVEKARTSAIQAIDQAKGRIVQSELRRHDADQFTAVIVADVAPDAAPAVIDRLKQIGRVSRVEIERKQTTPGGNPVDANNNALPPLPNAKVERKDTRLSISLYNLANIEPRQTSTVNLAADDVEKAYRAVLEEAKSAGGRIVTSQLVRPRPDTTTGTIVFESPTDKADAVLTAVRAVADVMRLDVQQNPDTQNTTDAKRKFAVSIVSLASVPAREGTQLVVATRKVSDSFAKVRDSVREAQGRVLTSQVSQANSGQFSAIADLTFEVPREGYAAIDKSLADSGQIVSRQVTRANDAENTVDSKVRLQIRFVDEAQLNPGETVTVNIAATSVNAQFGKLLEAVGAADGRILDSKLNEAEKENVTGTITFEMRRGQKASVEKALSEAGDQISKNVDRTHGTPESTLEDKIRFLVTLRDSDQLDPRETARIGMESDDVNKSVSNIRNMVLAVGGRTISQELGKERSGKTIAHVVADVPLSQANTVLAKLSEEGLTTSRQDSHNEQVPDGKLARMRIDLTIDNGSRIVESDQTLGSTIKKGLSTSIAGLLKALYFLTVGLCFVLPIVALVWLSVKIVRRNMRTPTTPPAGSAPTPA